MDIYTLALSIAYTNKTIKAAELEGFKVQVETTRDILETVGEQKTFYFLPKVVSEPQNGYDEYIYVNDSWELMGSTDIDLSGYMTLAPLNPTTEQISAMSAGQLYGDTVNHKGTIKDGQSFYDTVYIDENYRKTYTSPYNPPIFVPRDYHETAEDSIFKKGDRWVNKSWGAGFGVYVLNTITASANLDRFVYDWRREYETWHRNTNGDGAVPSVQIINEVQYQQGVRGWYETPNCLEGVVLYEASAELGGTIQKVYKCYATRVNGYQLLTYWAEISVPENYYTKTEINSMIGDIETALSQESGTIPNDNKAWYKDDSNYLLTGNYDLMGNTCSLYGFARVVNGQKEVYYSLPVIATQGSGTITSQNGIKYSVTTSLIDNTSVLEIKRLDGNNFDNDDIIQFTLIYKYK